MKLSDGTILQIVMYVITAAMTASTVLWRIKELEKKVEKHNGLVERMVVVEQSTRSAHHRIEDLKEDNQKDIDNLREDFQKDIDNLREEFTKGDERNVSKTISMGKSNKNYINV